MTCCQCPCDTSQFLVNNADDVNATVFHTIISNTITTLSAECPTVVTITPDVEPFEPGDVLTCSADGYNPSYTWTGTVNGVAITSHTGSTYTLEEGDFKVFCTATIDQLTCTGTASDSVAGTAVGKYELQPMLL